MTNSEHTPSHNARSQQSSTEPPTWRTYLLITIIPVLLSGVISWYIASSTSATTAKETTESILRSEKEKGDVVFNSIGYRYFMALVTSLNHQTSKFNHPPSKFAYRKALKDIQEDIRWLHRNPLFIEHSDIIDKMNRLHFRLSEELAYNDDSAHSATLKLACKEFVKSSSWRQSVLAYQKDNDQHITYLLDITDAICKKNHE